MKPHSKELEQDVLVGTFKSPPPDLQTAGCHNGLLEDLVILGDHPITEVIIRDMGLA